MAAEMLRKPVAQICADGLGPGDGRGSAQLSGAADRIARGAQADDGADAGRHEAALDALNEACNLFKTSSSS